MVVQWLCWFVLLVCAPNAWSSDGEPAESSTIDDEIRQFNETRRKETIVAMSVLAGWSVANFGVGGVGWATTDNPQWRAFHQANIGWNTVNLALAVPGLVGAIREDTSSMTLGKSIQISQRQKIMFAFNAGLDVGYIVMGAWMIERGENRADPRFIGFGRSMIIQGGYLLVFDLALWMLRQHRENRFFATPMVGEVLGIRANGRF